MVLWVWLAVYRKIQQHYFHSRIYIYIEQIIFIQPQRNIRSFNTFIQLQLKLFFFNIKISIQLLYLKFPDIPNVYSFERSAHWPGGLLGCVVKMASDEDRLTQIVREWVRNEMAQQRSRSASNASLLSRIRNLISNATRWASREAAGAALSAVEASFEAELPTQHSGVFQTTRKRSASTWNHPWPFKKDKSKNVKPEFHPMHPGIICNRCYFVVSLNKTLFEMSEVAFAQI